MSGGWIGKHKKELLGALALGGGAMFLPGLLGAGAGATAAGSAAAGAGAGASDAGGGGLLGLLGSMGPEQASALAAQNAGLGLGADIATLDAAATAGGGGLATPWGALGKIGSGLGAFGKAATVANMLGGGQQPIPIQPPPAPSGGGAQIVPTFPSLAQTYGQPAMTDEERKRRLMAQLQMLQQTGGLG